MSETNPDAPVIAVPIQTDKDGNIRVGGTRVLLEVIVARFQQGSTAEQIHEGFPTLKLADIYAVISYYLSNQEQVEAYMRRQDEEAQELLQKLEAEHPEMFVLQNKLRRLLAEKEK